MAGKSRSSGVAALFTVALSGRSALASGAHLLYLLLALPSFFLLLFAYPNFHAPDDPDHFKRAYTLIQAPFEIVTPQGKQSGAMVDSSVHWYADKQYDIVMRPDWARFDRSEGPNPLRELKWSGEEIYSGMAGAVSYLPFLYAPQTIAIMVGRSTGMTIDQTVFMARVLNGLAAIALTWLGLLLLPQGHALVLAILFLPRTMLQYASNSADPMLFALALLVVALALRPSFNRGLTASAMSFALLCAAAVRPPLAALAAVPMGLGLLGRQAKVVFLTILASGLAATWTIWTRLQIVDQRCPGQQGSVTAMAIDFAMHAPMLLQRSFAENGSYYFISLVAHFGQGNGPAGYVEAPFPWPIYAAAFLLLMWAIRLDSAEPNHLSRAAKALLVLSAVGMTLLIFLAMYAACSAIQSGIVAGVQGRYFVTAFFALAPALAGSLAQRHAWTWRPFAMALSAWVLGCVALMVTAAPAIYRL